MRTVVLALVLTAPVFAQATFEVVSVKPAGTAGHYGIGVANLPGGRIEGSSATVDYLIQLAFDLQPFQIAGAPRWAKEDRFDVMGKPPESSPLSQYKPASFKSPLLPEQRQMLQAVLADRFQLQSHWETKEGPIYLLVKNGKALKLLDSKDKNEYPWAGAVANGGPFADGVRGINESMANLAERISSVMGVPVIDRTGLEGSYDFSFRYVGDADADRGAIVMSSLQGLGLKLEAGKGPVRTLVIDRVEHPTAN
jgi:uncharacterized protein (TIGR03435 family)